jgi:hypothetical protein
MSQRTSGYGAYGGTQQQQQQQQQQHCAHAVVFEGQCAHCLQILDLPASSADPRHAASSSSASASSSQHQAVVFGGKSRTLMFSDAVRGGANQRASRIACSLDSNIHG